MGHQRSGRDVSPHRRVVEQTPDKETGFLPRPASKQKACGQQVSLKIVWNRFFVRPDESIQQRDNFSFEVVNVQRPIQESFVFHNGILQLQNKGVRDHGRTREADATVFAAGKIPSGNDRRCRRH
jgi:hypothetical protein